MFSEAEEVHRRRTDFEGAIFVIRPHMLRQLHEYSGFATETAARQAKLDQLVEFYGRLPQDLLDFEVDFSSPFD